MINSLALQIVRATSFDGLKRWKTERSLKHAFHGKDVALIQVVEAELIGSLRRDIQIGLKIKILLNRIFTPKIWDSRNPNNRFTLG